MAKKAFFLDRDGVVIRQISYLHDPALVELEKNVPEAIRKIHEKGMLAVVLTNQSGVARGMFTEKDVELCHERLQELLTIVHTSVKIRECRTLRRDGLLQQVER